MTLPIFRYKQLVFPFYQLGACGAWHGLISANTLCLCAIVLPGRGLEPGRDSAEEQAAQAALPGPAVMTLPGRHNAPTLGDHCGLPMTDGGLLRQGSWAGLLRANGAAIRAADVPASRRAGALAPPLPGK